MDILIGWQPYETTFKGEAVSMELRPLFNDQYRLVLPFMRKFETREETTQKILEMLTKCESIFEACVRDVKGVTVNGSPPTSKDLCYEAKIALLSQDIVQQLFIISTVPEGEEKNFAPPSDSSSSEDHPLSLSEA